MCGTKQVVYVAALGRGRGDCQPTTDNFETRPCPAPNCHLTGQGELQRITKRKGPSGGQGTGSVNVKTESSLFRLSETRVGISEPVPLSAARNMHVLAKQLFLHTDSRIVFFGGRTPTTKTRARPLGDRLDITQSVPASPHSCLLFSTSVRALALD